MMHISPHFSFCINSVFTQYFCFDLAPLFMENNCPYQQTKSESQIALE
jgi:hypothetical protein